MTSPDNDDDITIDLAEEGINPWLVLEPDSEAEIAWLAAHSKPPRDDEDVLTIEKSRAPEARTDARG